jgi:hypothetical protein
MVFKLKNNKIMIQDIIGILPPNEFTQGNRYSFLQDIKNAGDYTETKDARGTEFMVNSRSVYGNLIVRNMTIGAKPSVKAIGEPDAHTLWNTIRDIITACETPETEAINPACHIALKYLYVEADAAILNDIIPTGIRLADGTLTFADFTVVGDSAVDEVKSIDETKVVFRCHLGGSLIQMDELKTWIEFANVSNKNISLLTHFEYVNLTTSTTYTNGL